jgi:hypothetical protein
MEYAQVVYATRTHHSKKLAQAVGKALGVEAKTVDQCMKGEQAEVLFIVGGIYAGKCHPELVFYAQTLDTRQVRNVVLITSSASVTHRKQQDIRAILTMRGISVLDEITCPGALLFIKPTHPNKRDLQSVAGSARNIAAKAIISYMHTNQSVQRMEE